VLGSSSSESCRRSTTRPETERRTKMRSNESRIVSRRRPRWPFLVAALGVAAVCITGATAAQQAAAPSYKPAGGWGRPGPPTASSLPTGWDSGRQGRNVYVATATTPGSVFSAKGAFLRKWARRHRDGQFGNPGMWRSRPTAPSGSPTTRTAATSFSSSGAFRRHCRHHREAARDVAVEPDGSVLGAVEGTEKGGFTLRQDGKRWILQVRSSGAGVVAADEIEARLTAASI